MEVSGKTPNLDPSAVRVALHVGGLRAGSGGRGKILGHGHDLWVIRKREKERERGAEKKEGRTRAK